MANSKVTDTFRYKSILVKRIYYFGKILYLYKLMSRIRVTNDNSRLKEIINKHLNKYNQNI